MQALLDGFFAARGVNLDAEPTPGALRAMQRLLDGVPERWRDADVAWWPNSTNEMWAPGDRCEVIAGPRASQKSGAPIGGTAHALLNVLMGVARRFGPRRREEELFKARGVAHLGAHRIQHREFG